MTLQSSPTSAPTGTTSQNRRRTFYSFCRRKKSIEIPESEQHIDSQNNEQDLAAWVITGLYEREQDLEHGQKSP